MQDLRYPIGQFTPDGNVTDEKRRAWIEEIARTPERVRAAVTGLSPEQLDTPYRPGGWTVRQVVHHLPDSHMNAYVRVKLALTEEEPTIKTYEQERWAELFDAKTVPVETSLTTSCNCTPGTGGIPWRTSPRCGSGWGRGAGSASPMPRRRGARGVRATEG